MTNEATDRIRTLVDDPQAPLELRTALASKLLDMELDRQRLDLERETSRAQSRLKKWSTPLAIALTGVITISATFAVDYFKADQKADQALTLEQLKRQLDARDAELRSELALQAKENEASIAAEAARRKFEYGLLEREIGKYDNPAQRAQALLFLTEAGLLEGLNTRKLAEWAERSLRKEGVDLDDLQIPDLSPTAGAPETVGDILDGLKARGIDGYRDDFLAGLSLPIPSHPSLGKRRDYGHFSVVMDADRPIARIAAWNTDMSLQQHGLRPRNYFLDPVLGEDEQTSAGVYRNNRLDRGHIVGRRSVTWGPDLGTAQLAGASAFFYPNISPQYDMFNRGLWLEIENTVLQRAVDLGVRITGFAGPVIADSDKIVQGQRVPQKFWMLAVAVDEGGQTRATAFLAPQKEDMARFRRGEPLRPFIVTLDVLETLTGFDFAVPADAQLFID